MEEIWKDIAGYEGLYQVSNLGRVRSYDRYVVKIHPKLLTPYTFILKGKVLKNKVHDNGYLYVSLYSDKTPKNHYIHRLVAMAFVQGHDDVNNVVNHKDENKKNNHWTNLEWCTQIYNNEYSDIQGKATAKKMKRVCQYDINGCFIKEYESLNDAARNVGIDAKSIWRVCNKIYDSAGGYIWRYAE